MTYAYWMKKWHNLLNTAQAGVRNPLLGCLGILEGLHVVKLPSVRFGSSDTVGRVHPRSMRSKPDALRALEIARPSCLV